MKTAMFVILLGVSFTAFSQEDDDMYFTSKDRAKQELTVRSNRTAKEQKSNTVDERTEDTSINPTDSYSARNINPEYISRSQSDAEETDESGYFSDSYAPISVNKNLYNDYSTNNQYSPYYGYNNGFNPYNYYGGYGMGGMYSPYSMMGMGFRPGLSIGMGYGMGSMYNGWYGSMGYGMGGMYGMYDPFWGSSMMYSGMYGMYSPWGMYNPYYGGYGYYPGTVVVVGDGGSRRPITYQRRSDRSRVTNNTTDNSSRGVASTNRTNRTVGTSNGRTSSQSQDYYQRGWRNNGTVTSTNSRSSWSNSSSDGNNTVRVKRWDSGGNSSSGFNNGGFSNGSSDSGNSNWGGSSGSNSRSSWSNGNNSSFGSGSFGGGGNSRGSFGGGGGGSQSGGGGSTSGTGRRH